MVAKLLQTGYTGYSADLARYRGCNDFKSVGGVKMYTTLKRLYNNGKGPLTVSELNRAVSIGWITEQQKNSIIGG